MIKEREKPQKISNRAHRDIFIPNFFRDIINHMLVVTHLPKLFLAIQKTPKPVPTRYIYSPAQDSIRLIFMSTPFAS